MKRILRRWLECLPYGSGFDQIFLFIMFTYAQGRIPRRSSALANDYFYFLKTSFDILDIYRQITSDKVLVKDFIRQRCGDGLTLETIDVFDRVDEINIDLLPKPCVLKPAHSSGSVVFLEERQKGLSAEDKQTLMEALQTSPYVKAREGNYRHLRPRLICEPMLVEGANTKDYKVFCFKGKPRLIQVDSERHSDHRRNIYTVDWRPLEVKYNFPVGDWEDKPPHFNDMIEIAKVLAVQFEFVRVDFFISGKDIFVGELTHCPESAHGRFQDRRQEKLFSSILFSNGTKF